VDFFFMSGGGVEFGFEMSLVAGGRETRQHFFSFFTIFIPSSISFAVLPARLGSAKANLSIGLALKRRLILQRRSR
jgi:hypothetical protein